jgi:LuxR family transcriptional regulator, maltose regulon positive regulatory protein
LSLDEGDNDPARFLAYLVAALRTIAPKIGEGALGALLSPQPLPTESVLTAPVVDQAALHGLLRKVRDLGMPLLSVIQS